MNGVVVKIFLITFRESPPALKHIYIPANGPDLIGNRITPHLTALSQVKEGSVQKRRPSPEITPFPGFAGLGSKGSVGALRNKAPHRRAGVCASACVRLHGARRHLSIAPAQERQERHSRT